ncbi:glycosyltransferase family 2 protein [Urechidicola vernalis]|uniref:Glycosyltransferase family 2 protein n=1 Tax=Urechidicola vernalis TaxID=3075600 RepID=A0ABU2Y5C3_9FLAO|nr:glycosyltransferase family 2 protein [Urechidicola sp. P050]MDT0552268.1 glycosyltransferase family 2 protein [Urechidicola sp. P050]
MIYVIIVTYNGEKWIKACLDSLASSSMPQKVVVVDNSSTDGTVDLIQQYFSKVYLLEQSENLGFGKANNIGISYALDAGADLVLLLNQDAKVEKHTLKRLLEYSDLNSEYGIISPVHYNWNGDNLEYYFDLFSKSNSDLVTALKNQEGGMFEVSFVNAAAWLLPKKTLEAIGGFDPMFYHYGEDNNYCQRVIFHGLKIGVVSDACIYHDSTVRKGNKAPLFSEAYFNQEIKQLYVQAADINKNFALKERNNLRLQQLKVTLRNLRKGHFKNVFGYLKKYLIFERRFNKILRSREVNKNMGRHYL